VQQLAARHPTTGVDPPQRDLDDILASSCPMRFDEVGLLLMDAPEAQRR
jgi:hypothetical protein